MYLHHQGREGVCVGVGVRDGTGVGVKVGVGVEVGDGTPVGVGVGEEVGVGIGVGVGEAESHPTAEQTLILPHLKSVPVPVIGSAVDSIWFLTWEPLHPGF